MKNLNKYTINLNKFNVVERSKKHVTITNGNFCYRVSSVGEIYTNLISFDRYNGYRTGVFRLMKPAYGKTDKFNGSYYSVQLSFKGKVFSLRVHTIVAHFFIRPCPENMEIDHIDRNRKNNNVKNLRYVTHKENMKHSWCSNSFARITGIRSSQIERNVEIYKAYKNGTSKADLARSFSMDPSTVSKMLKKHSSQLKEIVDESYKNMYK